MRFNRNKMVGQRKIFLIEPHPDDIFLGAHYFCHKYELYNNSILVQMSRGSYDLKTKQYSDLLAAQRNKETLAFMDDVGIGCREEANLYDRAITSKAVGEFLVYVMRKHNLNENDVFALYPCLDRHEDHKAVTRACRNMGFKRFAEYVVWGNGITLLPAGEVIECQNKVRDFKRFFPSQYQDLIVEQEIEDIAKRLVTEEIFWRWTNDSR